MWQEAGQDYITASIYANLLDYTTDELSGSIVSGTLTEPVKFEEYSSFTRLAASIRGNCRISDSDNGTEEYSYRGGIGLWLLSPLQSKC